jgi:hypothetical protein
MPAQNDVEMQYQAAAPMDASKISVDTASTQDQVRERNTLRFVSRTLTSLA